MKLNQNVQSIEKAKAGTSSRSVLAGIMANPTGVGRYKFAIEQARYYKRSSGDADATTTALQVDKALVNVGALMLEGISCRVSTEIDPRDATNTEKLIARGRQLVSLYADVGVGKDKILMRMPATWAAIQAAKVLEAEGVATHLVCLFSFVQAVAAAQAGASVLQINVGRLGDWYDKHPGKYLLIYYCCSFNHLGTLINFHFLFFFYQVFCATETLLWKHVQWTWLATELLRPTPACYSLKRSIRICRQQS